MASENGVNRTGLIAAASACMFVFGTVLLLMGSLLPSLQVSNVQAGNLGSVPLSGILMATILVGPILDKAGGRFVLVTGLALIVVSLALLSILHRYPELIAAAFAYGLGGGLLNTATNALVSEISASRRLAALNLLGLFFSLGAIVAPLMMSSIGGSLPPSVVLRFLSAVTAMVMIPILVLRFPPPTQAGTRIVNLLSVLTNPVVWVFGALLFFESGSENCMFVWSSKVVAQVSRTSPQQANVALVGLSSALGAGRLMAVLWLRWLGSRYTLWLSSATVVVGALIASASREFAPMTASMVVIGLGLSAVFPTALGLAGDRFPAETGTVFGAIMTVALVGGTVGPSLAARLAASGPTKVLWVPIGSAAAIATLTAIATRRKYELTANSSESGIGPDA
jgi:MFS transporter, FHS family, glucose/mannose:H+ symporter